MPFRRKRGNLPPSALRHPKLPKFLKYPNHTNRNHEEVLLSRVPLSQNIGKWDSGTRDTTLSHASLVVALLRGRGVADWVLIGSNGF